MATRNIGRVAPYVGAWIETHCESLRNLHHLVAPYVGAWIETSVQLLMSNVFRSHPMWVRGLKHLFGQQGAAISMSHPMWVRGLKP